MPNFINSELTQLNPWWIQPELINKDDKLIEFESQKFKFWPKFYRNYPLSQDAIFTLRGPRRVGKTTLIKLLIKKLLLEQKIPPAAIFYYSLERVADYNQLFELIKTYLDFARARTKAHLHLFLDEVTFVDGWVRAIKDLADRGLLKNTTLTLTGSNVLELTASGERLPGRRGEIFQPDINFYPLHFGEFLSVVAPDLLKLSREHLFHLELAHLQKYLQDYLLTGGFIFNINQYYAKGHIPSFAYELFAAWVTGDMFKLNRSEEFTLRIIEQLLKHLGSTVSFTRLAREAGIASAATAQEYLELLERMFVVLKVPFFSLDQKRPDVKKNSKIYFADPFVMDSLLACAQGVLDEAFQLSQAYLTSEFMPKLAEMLVATTLRRFFPQRLYFGVSGKNEVDFVAKKGGQWHYFEVKYQKGLLPSEVQLPPALKDQPVLIITQDRWEKKGNLTLVPLSIWAAFPEEFL